MLCKVFGEAVEERGGDATCSWAPKLALQPQMEHAGGLTLCHFFQMADIVEVSRTSTLELQNQLDDYKEKNRRELAEMQRQLKEKTLEAEKSRLTASKMQEEVTQARPAPGSTFIQSILPDCTSSRKTGGGFVRQHPCLIPLS